MAKNRVEREPLPAHFETLHETAEFWDARDLAESISQQASRRGVSAETLINLWLSEKLHDLAA